MTHNYSGSDYRLSSRKYHHALTDPQKYHSSFNFSHPIRKSTYEQNPLHLRNPHQPHLLAKDQNYESKDHSREEEIEWERNRAKWQHQDRFKEALRESYKMVKRASLKENQGFLAKYKHHDCSPQRDSYCPIEQHQPSSESNLIGRRIQQKNQLISCPLVLSQEATAISHPSKDIIGQEERKQGFEEIQEVAEYQKQELQDTAREMQKDLVGLINMFYDTLGIVFEMNLLELMKGSQGVEKMRRGCTKRFNLAEKMMMNQLEDIDTDTPYGEILRKELVKKIHQILSKGGNLIEARKVKEIVQKFIQSVQKGINLWKDRKVVEANEAKPLDEVKVNYVVSLLNKGLIETDRREVQFNKTGQAEERDLLELFEKAEKKLLREIERIEKKQPSEIEELRQLFEQAKEKQEIDFR